MYSIIKLKINLKTAINLLILLVLATSSLATFGQAGRPALKAVQSKAPKVEESDIVLKLPSQYYYFTEATVDGNNERQLHCYFPKTEVDVTLDIPFYDWSVVVDAAWYDKANDNVYLAINTGGLEVRQLTIYKINKKNTVYDMMELEGYMPRAYNDYDDSMMCYASVDDNFVSIKGYKDGQEISGVFNYDLTPATLASLSDIKLTPKDIGFVRITADGVNIRREPNTKAPRLGYFHCSQCEDTDYENPQLWEDDPEGEKPFEPFHPNKGTIYSYPKSEPIVEGWQPLGDGQYVSSKFVEEVIPEPITIQRNIESNDLHMVKQGKYIGLCIFKTEDGMYDEGMLYFGKPDNAGMIQFYGTCPVPRYDPDIKGFKLTNDVFRYGSDYGKETEWGYAYLDLKKLTTSDIDLLMSNAKPLGRINMILVGLPGGEDQFFYF